MRNRIPEELVPLVYTVEVDRDSKLRYIWEYQTTNDHVSFFEIFDYSGKFHGVMYLNPVDVGTVDLHVHIGDKRKVLRNLIIANPLGKSQYEFQNELLKSAKRMSDFILAEFDLYISVIPMSES